MKKIWSWLLFLGGILLTVVTLGLFNKNDNEQDKKEALDNVEEAGEEVDEAENFDNPDDAANYIDDILSDDNSK